MTEEEKHRQLLLIELRARIAERNGLPETAQSWRDTYKNLLNRKASEVVLARHYDPETERKIDMELSSVYGGDSLKAADLQGAEPVVTIATVTVKEFDKGRKLVVTFVGKKKALICNKTNANRIAFVHGTNTDNWIGKKIQLYTDLVDFQGKATEAIRVRPVKQGAAARTTPAPAPAPSEDDDAPFDDSVADIGASF